MARRRPTPNLCLLRVKMSRTGPLMLSITMLLLLAVGLSRTLYCIWNLSMKNESQQQAATDLVNGFKKKEKEDSSVMSDDVSQQQQQTPVLENHSNNNNNTTTPPPLPPFIAFLRMPKTGSTSLLSFLSHPKSGLMTWKRFLYYAADLKDATINKDTMGPSCCVHGPAAIALSVNNNNKYHSDNNNPLEAFGDGVCAHLPLGTLHQRWDVSRDYWTPRLLTTTLLPSIQKQPITVFTMVREPFERLRSLYFYVRLFCNDDQWGIRIMSNASYTRLCAGDFGGWLEMLYKEQNEHPYIHQYRFLDQHDVDRAISYLEGDDSPVLVVLHECFEDSLRLLEKKFSLTPGVTNVFLNEDDATLVHQRQHQGDQRVDNAEKLRESAKRLWFEDDYKFYNATVVHFKRQLASVNIEPSSSLTDSCTQYLASYG